MVYKRMVFSRRKSDYCEKYQRFRSIGKHHKTDKSGFACDRCIHGQTELCNRICGYNNQFLKFHFQYVYWKNILVKRNEWDKI